MGIFDNPLTYLGPIGWSVEGAQAIGNAMPGSGSSGGQGPSPALPTDPNQGAFYNPSYDAGAIPTPAGDFDMSKAGASENFYGDNAGKFGGPTYGEALAGDSGFTSAWGQSPSSDYWNGVAGKYQSGTPGATNRAEEAYQQFQRTQPVDMSPYYDREVQTGTNDINRQLASRGMFGSTVGMNQLGNAIGGIRAQQAKDEAGYQLNRGQLAGTLGASADTSSRGQSANQLAWTQGLGQLAGQADQDQLARLQGLGQFTQGIDTGRTNLLNAGMNAAQNADTERQNRVFGLSDRTFAQDQANAAATAGIGGQGIQSYLDLMNAIISMQTGGATQNANNDASNRATQEAQAETLASAFTGGRKPG